MFFIGLDVGSTTIKSVVLNSSGSILYKSYDRHMAKAKEKAVSLLAYINEHVTKGAPVKIAITGSAGLGISQLYDIEFVQEVYSTQVAVRKYYPDADVIIELGGEDAKILFISGMTEVRMNGTCAGGTGAFIDQMAVLLGVNLDEFDALSLDYKKLYTIASRCGVFAKSDIQPLANQGAQKNDLAASIFQAVVGQTIGGLAQGREIQGKIVFLGGPLSFFKGLRQRFVETLNLTEGESAIFPDNGQYFVALGAALYAMNTNETELSEVIGRLLVEKEVSSANNLPPLFESEEQYKQFAARHGEVSVEYTPLGEYEGNAYLGVDAGSTTTKIVLAGEKGEILYEKYISNTGNAVEVIRQAIIEIYEKGGSSLKIAGSAVTGYGEELVKNAFKIDHGIVETIAHYTAARRFMPNVDFIIDIGGQDVKCFKLRNEAIDSIMLNEACSSGCGSFLETFATTLGYSVADFATAGLLAKAPVDLGSRCTVFMNSSVKQAQKEGATVADISAGLSISVIKNAIYKVIRASSSKELGHNIVVQGGTFLNDAVLRAFEKELDANVIRTPISGLMGAYGCALFAKANKTAASGIISREELEGFGHTVTSAMCNHCENHCRLTVNRFKDGSSYISGNKCERYSAEEKFNIEYNAYEYKYNYLTRLDLNRDGKRGRIGIPLVLNMYENLPFWTAFFRALDFEIVLSPRSTRELYSKGQHTIPSDTVCYPAKLAHGHIEALVNMGVDAVFYPCMSYNFDEGLGDNHYNCAVVAYYPEVIEANASAIKEVKYIYDYMGLHKRKFFTKKIAGILAKYFEPLDEKEIQKAVGEAYKAQAQYQKDVKAYCKKAIAYAGERSLPVIVLAGRPYHVDPEINHGLDKLITGYGAVVISEDGICSKLRRSVSVLNQWTYHSRLYNAAFELPKYENMSMIQLVSFGCGLDAVTTDEVRAILEKNGQIYTQIKIDEINNLGATKIRIRSLFAALEQRKNKANA